MASDVALIHVASMSNLFAVLGWMLIDLLTHPDELARVRAGDRARAEVCTLESTRLAQRSIMARHVVMPVTIDVGESFHEVGVGATIATLLPLTNTSAAPGLECWVPGRWNRRRLADPSALAAVELVTVFGHGRHTCPAQPFSLSTMTAAASRLLQRVGHGAGLDRAPQSGAHSDRRRGASGRSMRGPLPPSIEPLSSGVSGHELGCGGCWSVGSWRAPGSVVEADVAFPCEVGAAQAIVDPLEVVDQHAGEVVAEPVAYHDAQHLHGLEVGWQGVGGNQPAAVSEVSETS